MLAKRLGFPLLLIAIAALVAWSGLHGQEHNKPNKLIMIMQTTDYSSNFWQTVRNGALAAAKELNVEVTIDGPLNSNDAKMQLQMLENAVGQRPRVIIIAPIDEEILLPIVKGAAQKGIKIVMLDTPLAGFEAESYVASNHDKEGRQAGEAMAASVRNKPVFAFLSDTSTSVISKQRRDGALTVLSSKGGLNLGTIHIGMKDSEEQAYRTARSLLDAYPNMNGIVALTEPAALGASKALKEAGATRKVSLIGFGGSIYEIQMLEEGTIRALVVQNPFNIGFLSIETAQKLARSKQVNSAVDVPSTIIMKRNMYTPENQRLLFPFVQ